MIGLGYVGYIGISSFVRANWHGVNEERKIRFVDSAKNARHGFLYLV